MLEEAVYDADDLDVVAQARHPGTQGAHAADDHLDGHPRLTGGIEAVDEVSVHQVVDLEGDAAGLARLGVGQLVVDEAIELAAAVDGGDQQVVEFVAFIGVLDVFEHPLHLGGDVRVAGQQGEVGVDLGGLLVEVAGADMGVAHRLAIFVAGDEAELGVDLEAGYPEHHLDPRIGQNVGPVDVGRLVETGAQLHHHCHLLAVVGGVDEGVDDP